jgi:hypothetical protein
LPIQSGLNFDTLGPPYPLEGPFVKVNEIIPDASAFKYNAPIRDLTLGVGHALSFNLRSQRFEFDKNPFGDPHLVPMDNVVLSDDFSQLAFQATYQRKQRQFVIAAANECHRIMFEFFARLNASGFNTEDGDADHVELHFQQDRLASIEIYKHPKPLEDLVDSLHIFSEADRYYLIKSGPRRKFELSSITMDGNKLISRSADEEFVYNLDVQPVILETVQRLVKCSLTRRGGHI